MTDAPVLDQTIDAPVQTMRDRLSLLDTREFTGLLRHDVRRLMTDATMYTDILVDIDVAYLDNLEQSPSTHPRIREAITENRRTAIDVRRTEHDSSEAIKRENAEKEGIEYHMHPFKETPNMIQNRFLPYLGERAEADILETNDQTLAIEMYKLGLAADKPDRMSEEEVERTKKIIRKSMTLLPIFADSAHFIKHPSDETLANLKAHTVNLKDLTGFFEGKVSYQGDELFDVDGVEMIIITNLIHNAIDHGNSQVIVEVIQEGQYHTIRVVNESKEPLTAGKLLPGVSTKVDENGDKKEGSGNGLPIVQTFAEAAGLELLINSTEKRKVVEGLEEGEELSPLRIKKEEGTGVYQITVSISDKPTGTPN